MLSNTKRNNTMLRFLSSLIVTCMSCVPLCYSGFNVCASGNIRLYGVPYEPIRKIYTGLTNSLKSTDKQTYWLGRKKVDMFPCVM